MTAEEYEEFIDYIVAQPKPELKDILHSQQQFIEEDDSNVLQEMLLRAPVVTRLITEARITEEELQWLGLAMCSVLVIGYCVGEIVEL